MSKGEIYIADWLNEQGIDFFKEYVFPDCKYKNVLRFDFYIPSYNTAIEFDGEGHYMPICFGGISLEQAEDNFELYRLRDEIKNNYCQEHNINLIRIGYDSLKTKQINSILIQNFRQDF